MALCSSFSGSCFTALAWKCMCGRHQLALPCIACQTYRHVPDVAPFNTSLLAAFRHVPRTLHFRCFGRNCTTAAKDSFGLLTLHLYAPAVNVRLRSNSSSAFPWAKASTRSSFSLQIPKFLQDHEKTSLADIQFLRCGLRNGWFKWWWFT